MIKLVFIALLFIGGLFFLFPDFFSPGAEKQRDLLEQKIIDNPKLSEILKKYRAFRSMKLVGLDSKSRKLLENKTLPIRLDRSSPFGLEMTLFHSDEDSETSVLAQELYFVLELAIFDIQGNLIEEWTEKLIL